MFRTLSLFSDLNSNELEELVKIVSEVSLLRGETIFLQGDMGRDFFIVKHGQVEISVKDFYQEKRVLAILKNGEFFGEMSLFEKEATRSATAQAFQNTVLYKIPGGAFESLLEDKPSICFKLLGTMSKRMRSMINPAKASPISEISASCKVLTIASARSGYGKTVLATTMAKLLSNEVSRRVLFLDLDLSFGDGSFLMSVYSPKSIIEFAGSLGGKPPSEEEMQKFVVRLPNNLSVLAAPRDLLEGERLSGEDVVKIISACRPHYDYIIIDTNSEFSEVFLNALDMSDHVFFLIACGDSIAIKSNNTFLRAITRLNLAESLVNIVLSYRNHGTKVEAFQRLFKWRIVGELPEIPNLQVDTGEMPYQKAPTGEFCNAVRLIMKSVLHEEALKISSEAGFLSKWFYPANHQALLSPISGMDVESRVTLDIDDEFCSMLLKNIHGKITAGCLDDALRECLQLVSLQPHSAGTLELLGEIFFLKRDLAHALEVMNHVLKLNPESYLALGFCAVIKSDEEMKKKAFAILSERLKLSPNYPDLLNDMGKLLYAFNQMDEAVGFFEKALAANPLYIEARLNLSVALGDLRRYEDALRQLIQIRPKNIRTFYLIGNYLYNTGKFFAANVAFNRVSKINPRYLDVQDKLGLLGDYFSKIHNLLEMHKKLSRLSPTFPDLHYTIANLHLLTGNREAAREEFLWVCELKPDHKDVKRKLELLADEPEFDPQKFAEEDQMDGLDHKFGPDAWIIEVDHLDALFREDPNHIYVLRMINNRTKKRFMFPLSPSLAKSPNAKIEAVPGKEIEKGDILNFEIFDNTGVLHTLTKQIEGDSGEARRIPLPFNIPENSSKLENPVGEGKAPSTEKTAGGNGAPQG